MAARSLPVLFKSVYGSSVPTLNATVEQECQYVTLPDGSVVPVDPVACAQKVQAKALAAKDNIIDKYISPILQGIAGAVPVIGTASSLAIKAANTIQAGGVGQISSPTQILQRTSLTGGSSMGIFDDLGITGQGGIFGPDTGSAWSNILNIGGNIATKFLQPSAMPMPAAVPTVAGGSFVPAMASVPAIAGRVGAVVGRGFFSRFPNLATSIQTLRNGGMNVTRSKLYGVMKRFGPEFLVSGGLLTAAAVNELAVAGPGRRRMNPSNSRALRRAARRIESFHRLCRHTDILASRGRRSKKH